mmetsp:Transcript_112028/g.321969  ORF Transcript_112028/g.321969 Transcript_112028/m.321969 type:complete len:111 (+) Transcript_112028:309-641(+)
MGEILPTAGAQKEAFNREDKTKTDFITGEVDHSEIGVRVLGVLSRRSLSLRGSLARGHKTGRRLSRLSPLGAEGFVRGLAWRALDLCGAPSRPAERRLRRAEKAAAADSS